MFKQQIWDFTILKVSLICFMYNFPSIIVKYAIQKSEELSQKNKFCCTSSSSSLRHRVDN